METFIFSTEIHGFKSLIIFIRDTYKGTATIFSGKSNLRLSCGFYQGMDLIPYPLEKDGSPKSCNCGVNKFVHI